VAQILDTSQSGSEQDARPDCEALQRPAFLFVVVKRCGDIEGAELVQPLKDLLTSADHAHHPRALHPAASTREFQ